MEQGRKNPMRKKQLVILITLLLILCAIIANPALRLGINELFPRHPVKLGTAEVSIPTDWMMSETATRVTVWKPCNTIFCDSAKASFVLEVKDDLLEDVWLRSATKVLRDSYSQDVVTNTIRGDSGLVNCVEPGTTVTDGRAVSSCINSDLHLTSTFTGKASLKPAFYAVLATARRVAH